MINTHLILLFVSITQSQGLPPGLLSALCFAESGHHVNAWNPDDGGVASSGICQLHLATARGEGYVGTERGLRNPAINMYYAARYLNRQLTRYNFDLRKAVAAYNAGTYHKGMASFARNQKYVDRVFKYWGEGR